MALNIIQEIPQECPSCNSPLSTYVEMGVFDGEFVEYNRGEVRVFCPESCGGEDFEPSSRLAEKIILEAEKLSITT